MQEKKTNKDRPKKKHIFTLITKRIKTEKAHTVISDDKNRVKSRRINYAKNYFKRFVCAKRKTRKQRSSVVREINTLMS